MPGTTKRMGRRTRQGEHAQQYGVYLRQAREEAEMTQEEVGAKFGLSKNEIGRWERGEYMFTAQDLIRLAAILKTSPLRLLGLPTALPANQERLLAAYRVLPADVQSLFLDMVLAAADRVLSAGVARDGATPAPDAPTFRQ